MNVQKHDNFRHAATNKKPTRPRKATVAKSPTEKLGRKEYEAELEKLQIELCHLQDWVRETKARIIIVCEGRDTAGKGGLIRRLTDRKSTRLNSSH